MCAIARPATVPSSAVIARDARQKYCVRSHNFDIPDEISSGAAGALVG